MFGHVRKMNRINPVKVAVNEGAEELGGIVLCHHLLVSNKVRQAGHHLSHMLLELFCRGIFAGIVQSNRGRTIRSVDPQQAIIQKPFFLGRALL